MQYYLIFLCENEFNKINLEFDAINLDDFKEVTLRKKVGIC